jgi:hypothetical protein
MKEDIRDVQMNVIMAPLKYDRNALKETINIQHMIYKHYNFLIYNKYFLLNINKAGSQENMWIYITNFHSLQSPPKGITVPYRPLKPVTVATNLGPQHAAVAAAVHHTPVSAGRVWPLSHAAAGHYTAAAAAAAASLDPATANAAHAALIPASAQVRQSYFCKTFHLLLPSFFSPR